jgi:hypothetical protein
MATHAGRREQFFPRGSVPGPSGWIVPPSRKPGNHHWWCVVLRITPLSGETLDVLRHGLNIACRQSIAKDPHSRPSEAMPDNTGKVLIRRELAGWSGPIFKNASSKTPRLRLQRLGQFSSSITARSMAHLAILFVDIAATRKLLRVWETRFPGGFPVLVSSRCDARETKEAEKEDTENHQHYARGRRAFGLLVLCLPRHLGWPGDSPLCDIIGSADTPRVRTQVAAQEPRPSSSIHTRR